MPERINDEPKVELNTLKTAEILALPEILAVLDTDGDGSVTAEELSTDAAKDEVHAALVKLGLSESTIQRVFSIEPPTIRKARRDEKDKAFKAKPAKTKKVKTK